MQEALTLFDSICNSRWFVKTSIVRLLVLLLLTTVSNTLPRFSSSTKSTSSQRNFHVLRSATTSLTFRAVTTMTTHVNICCIGGSFTDHSPSSFRSSFSFTFWMRVVASLTVTSPPLITILPSVLPCFFLSRSSAPVLFLFLFLSCSRSWPCLIIFVFLVSSLFSSAFRFPCSPLGLFLIASRAPGKRPGTPLSRVPGQNPRRRHLLFWPRCCLVGVGVAPMPHVRGRADGELFFSSFLVDIRCFRCHGVLPCNVLSHNICSGGCVGSSGRSG
jgi:hypothetical protein